MQSAEQTTRNFKGDHLSVKMFGAVGDGKIVSDAAITSGTAILSSASALFTPEDVGKLASVEGAGAAGATLSTVVQAYNSPAQLTLATNASTTVAGKKFYWGTDDTVALQSAITYCQGGYLTDGHGSATGRLVVPFGCYFHNGLTIIGNLNLEGCSESTRIGLVEAVGSHLLHVGTGTGLHFGAAAHNSYRHRVSAVRTSSTGAADYLIHAENCQELQLERVALNDTYSPGGGGKIAGLWLDNCAIVDVDGCLAAGNAIAVLVDTPVVGATGARLNFRGMCNFFQNGTCFQLGSVASLTIADSWFEQFNNFILVDSATPNADAVVVTNISVHGNHIVSPGIAPYTDPRALLVTHSNPAISVSITSFRWERNLAFCKGGNYVVELQYGASPAGSLFNGSFRHCQLWGGSVSGIHADSTTKISIEASEVDPRNDYFGAAVPDLTGSASVNGLSLVGEVFVFRGSMQASAISDIVETDWGIPLRLYGNSTGLNHLAGFAPGLLVELYPDGTPGSGTRRGYLGYADAWPNGSLYLTNEVAPGGGTFGTLFVWSQHAALMLIGNQGVGIGPANFFADPSVACHINGTMKSVAARLTGLLSAGSLATDGSGNVIAGSGSATPSGAAGGDLSGTYPNPSVAHVTAPAWTSYTPTITTTMSTSGTTINAAYLQWGKYVAIRIRVVVTLGGSASGLVSFSTPVNSKSGLTQFTPGSLEVGSPDIQCFAVGATIDCYTQTGNYTLAGHTFYVQGIYETD